MVNETISSRITAPAEIERFDLPLKHTLLQSHQPYRPDIDGLRAIAVIAVLLFHAFPAFLSGGFTGVDIFFVISGSLISAVIFNGLKDGTFNFRNFYARRIRRIFPALLLVLLASLAIGWLTLLSDEFLQLGKHTLAASGFVSNIILWKEAGYFDTTAELKPLLHLWSLGVEEQFYIFWPVLLYFAWKARASFIVVIFLLFALSMGLNLAQIKGNPVQTFYLPGPRFWELLLGSMLLMPVISRSNDSTHLSKISRIASNFFPSSLYVVSAETCQNAKAVVGFLLIGGAFFLLDKSHDYPGWRAIIPTAAAALIISAGPDAWINRKILSSKFLVLIGLISFPLYLWHWPILAFVRIIEGSVPSTAIRLMGLSTSFLLAWITYKFIERPVRKPASPVVMTSALVGLMFVVAASALLIVEGKILPRSRTFGLEKIIKAAGEWGYPGPDLKPLEFHEQQFFSRFNGNQPLTLYLGDSNIEQYGPRIARLIADDPEHTGSAIFAARGGCVPIPYVRKKGRDDCIKMLDASIAYAKSDRVKTIVIAAYWYAYLGKPSTDPVSERFYYDDGTFSGTLGADTEATTRALVSLERLLAELVATKKKVILVLNIPTGPEIDPKEMVRRTLFPIGFSINKNGLSTSAFTLFNDRFLRPQMKLLAARQGVRVIDPMDFLCERGVCPSLESDGEPIYKDDAHLRPTYVRRNVKFLDETIRAGSVQ
jgi:peptidoglycan/LPS O-acetylase OafA/YrhL